MQTIVQEFDIKSLFNSFIMKFGYFEISEDEFVQYGQSFVQFSTADAIYFGNYITAELDEALYAEPTYQVPVYEPSPCAKSKKKSDSNENVPKENLINQAFAEPTYPMQTFQPTEKKKRSYNKKVLKGNNWTWYIYYFILDEDVVDIIVFEWYYLTWLFNMIIISVNF